ncbi:MAG: tetratricopeptide repeat protein [Thermaerobacter sp.]|nr:tetratricopeptide repeat protein [Thermaerobacter sp.]
MELLRQRAGLQPLFLLTLARLYAAEGEILQAHQTLHEGLRRFPDYTDFLYLDGMLAMQEGKWDQAEAAFGTALELGPPVRHLQSELGVGGFKALWQLARVARVKGENSRAEAYYLKAIQVAPAFRPAWQELLGFLNNNPVSVIGEHLALVMPPATMASTMSGWSVRDALEESLYQWAMDQARGSQAG